MLGAVEVVVVELGEQRPAGVLHRRVQRCAERLGAGHAHHVRRMVEPSEVPLDPVQVEALAVERENQLELRVSLGRDRRDRRVQAVGTAAGEQDRHDGQGRPFEVGGRQHLAGPCSQRVGPQRLASHGNAQRLAPMALGGRGRLVGHERVQLGSEQTGQLGIVVGDMHDGAGGGQRGERSGPGRGVVVIGRGVRQVAEAAGRCQLLGLDRLADCCGGRQVLDGPKRCRLMPVPEGPVSRVDLLGVESGR